MALTAVQIVNRALQEIAAQATVTDTPPPFGDSAAGQAAAILYDGVVEMLLRSQEWEFSRRTVALVASSNAPPFPFGFSNEYLYPADCLRVLQVLPATLDPNDPQPVIWRVQDAPVGPGTPTRSILCSVPSARLAYVTNALTEDMWDPLFQEAAVRTLASELVMALSGRPDFSREKLVEAGQILSVSEGRDS